LIEKKQAEIRKVHPGLSVFKDRPGAKRIELKDIPGILETGWKPSGDDPRNSYQIELDNDMNRLTEVLEGVLMELKEHPFSWPFLEPVDESQAPGYYSIIKFPMDFQTVTERLRSRYYNCLRLFITDVKWIFNNCRAYNDRGTEFYKLANQMEKAFITKMKNANLWFDMNVT
jgi:histone acetyltransferase